VEPTTSLLLAAPLTALDLGCNRPGLPPEVTSGQLPVLASHVAGQPPICSIPFGIVTSPDSTRNSFVFIKHNHQQHLTFHSLYHTAAIRVSFAVMVATAFAADHN
jgi:hypothetical protein